LNLNIQLRGGPGTGGRKRSNNSSFWGYETYQLTRWIYAEFRIWY